VITKWAIVALVGGRRCDRYERVVAIIDGESDAHEYVQAATQFARTHATIRSVAMHGLFMQARLDRNFYTLTTQWDADQKSDRQRYDNALEGFEADRIEYRAVEAPYFVYMPVWDDE
jgi:hypothetical protein